VEEARQPSAGREHAVVQDQGERTSMDLQVGQNASEKRLQRRRRQFQEGHPESKQEKPEHRKR